MKNRNRSIVFGPNMEPEYLSKMTTSGLWVVCVTHCKFRLKINPISQRLFSVGSTNFTCIPINYFPIDKYRPDDQDSTNAIPCEKYLKSRTSTIKLFVLDTARKSSSYFLFSFILMLNGEFFCFTGFLKSSKKIFCFISGVSFIIAGKININ